MKYFQYCKRVISLFTGHLKLNCMRMSWLLLFASILIVQSNAYAAAREEYAVKAAFVLNFIIFTEWPEETADVSKDEIVLCVVGGDNLPNPFKALNGKKVRQKLLRVVHAPVDTNLPECQVIFYRENVDTQNLVRTLKAVRSKPVLTIGEKKNVTKLGGAIHFFKDSGKLRFAINLEIVSEQKLKMSSRLLQIATLIDD